MPLTDKLQTGLTKAGKPRGFGGEPGVRTLQLYMKSSDVGARTEDFGAKKKWDNAVGNDGLGKSSNTVTVAGGSEKPPDGFGKISRKCEVKIEEPPLSPLAALSNALIISRVSSSDSDKRRISHKAMDRIVALEKQYSNDERAQSFLRTVWSLVTTSGIAIGELNKEMNSNLAEVAQVMGSKITAATECMNSRLEHLITLKNMRLEYLEKTKLLRNIPSITTWLASIGVSAITIYTLEQEVLNFINKHLSKYPTLQELDHLTYCVAASVFVGAIIWTKKLINRAISRKQEKTENKFQESKEEAVSIYTRRKGKAEEEFKRAQSELKSIFVSDGVMMAANVYAEVYKLCIDHYPEFIQTDENYVTYSEIRTARGEKEAFEFLIGVGREEAKRQFANLKFLQEPAFPLNQGQAPNGHRTAA